MYQDPKHVRAILFGYLVNEFGKVQTSKMNKLLKELNHDKIGTDELKDFAILIDGDNELKDLADRAIEGKIKLEDIPKYKTENKPFEDTNPHNVITPYITAHERTKANNREFNKLKREGAYLKILMDDLHNDLKEDIKELGQGVPKDNDFDYKLQGSSLIVTLSDLHIGKVIQQGIGWGYNYNIMTRRLNEYMNQIKQLIQLYDADNIRLYMLGDMIEGTDMRKHQSFDTEFNMSQQISKAVQVMYKFIDELQTMKPVKVFITNGNHSRLQSNKKEKIYNDSVEYVVLDTLIHIQQTGKQQLANVEFYDNRQAMNIFFDDVQGFSTVGTHGDFGKGNKGAKINGLNLSQPVNLLFTGHLHTLSINQENSSNMAIQSGSVMGADTYSKENFFNEAQPSQTLVVINKKLQGPIIYPVYFK